MNTRVILLLVGLLAAVPASAQTTRIGTMLGFNSDLEEVTLGLNGHVGIDLGDREVLLGVVAELFPFISGRSHTVLDFDLLLPAEIGMLGLYGGGGLTLRHIARKVGPSDTDLGANLKAGLLSQSESRGWVPFIEAVQTIGADTDFTVRAGVFFRIGGR